VRRVDLSTRDEGLRELMDDPDCDLAGLRHTYAQFRVVNRLVAGWGRVYRRRIRPLLAADRASTLLDIGSGGGDLARALSRWASRDGFDLAVTAIDPDGRAHAYATAQDAVAGVTFRRAGSADLVAEGAQFDVVVSNHLLHHLDAVELHQLLADSDRLARRLVVHNDIARSRLAYAAYRVVSRPFGRRSFIHIDGLRSIRRSYRVAELAEAVAEPWRVAGQFPARVLLLRDVQVPATASQRARPASESINP
jgi:2-polyprenyl-3-methyl-5-hydroxy-6-metoxy-1,4-benzoquinol methylase